MARGREHLCFAGEKCGFLQTSWKIGMLCPHTKLKATVCKRIGRRICTEAIFVVAKK